MPTVPLIPDTAPFTPEQRAWLNGFFAGLFSRSAAVAQPNALNTPPAPPLTALTILFGSQTGTAESLAKRAAKLAGQRHFAATVVDMAACDPDRLATEKNLLVITSTYGDGEPPDNARTLHAALQAKCHLLNDTSPVPLRELRYSVCALGDTNYVHFCKCGADFDTWLERLGATRISPRADCDLDYETAFTTWLDATLSAFSKCHLLNDTSVGAPSVTVPEAIAQSAAQAPQSASESGFNRANPFPALLLTSRNLNASGSAKQVHHVEFDLTGSGLAYEAGDALGVYPHNCPELVSEILIALGCDGEEAVPTPTGATTSLRHALTELYDLGRPTPELLALLPSPVAASASAPGPAPHHVIDALLTRADLKPTPEAFVGTLKKLQPRLYSISSSPRAHAGRVHLTVGAVRYELNGRARKGVCSTFLADRVTPGASRASVFIHANRAFRLPASDDTPIIMVGPGTGIAPFRGFLHERRAAGARGRTWLFFGDQRAATDFLYRDELAALQQDGVLTRLHTAFSRDQPEKIYVQHRMLEHAAELFAWLEAGAHFYICGDAARMAKDVDAALHTVVERGGGRTRDEAATYVQSLETAKRYCRDVY